MAELQINAHISEVGGAYYPVRLEWVPRVGELISLYSFIDQVDGNQSTHKYEVVQVVHEVYDVTDKTPHGDKGMHFVTVYVKRSQNSLFSKVVV